MPDPSAAGGTAKPAVLITGVGGQDGIYLARHLSGLGYAVHGTVRRPQDASPYLADVDVHEHDVRDQPGFGALLDRIRPVHVYNLAGFSSVAASWAHAHEVCATNGTAVLGLLDELLRFRDAHGWAPRFYQASSSEMFGRSRVQPQDEDTAHHPRSPYAVAKSFAHNLTVNYRESYGLFAATGILYNHESPLRGTQFVTRKVARAAARISLGLDESIAMGNLDARRDWGAASDYVEAMHRTLMASEAQDFVIATGVTHSVREFVETAFDVAGLGAAEPYIRQDPTLIRPAEVVELCGDPSRARTELGWTAHTSFLDLVTDMVKAEIRRAQGLDDVIESPEPRARARR